MTERRKPGLLLPVIVVVLLAVYAGAYYGTVRPLGLPFVGTAPHYPLLHGGTIGDPDFNITTLKRWHTVFTPIHWLDRRLRPHIWESDE